MNISPIHIDVTRSKLSDKFCKLIGSNRFVLINDKDIHEIRKTISALRRYIVNEILIYGGVVRKTDITNIVDIIYHKFESDYLYHWWKENLRYSELFKNRDFREIFWDIGINLEDKYDYIKETWNFIVTGFGQRIDRYNNEDAFIANILNSERVKKHYCNMVYDVKSIDINWYIENKSLFIHNATLE